MEGRVLMLSAMLVGVVAHPERLRAVRFALHTPEIRDGDTEVAIRSLDGDDAVTLESGDLLAVIDPDLGDMYGRLEITGRRTVRGDHVARVADGAPLWIGYLRAAAGERREFTSRGVAIAVSVIGSAEGRD
jgi:hypothetical protein